MYKENNDDKIRKQSHNWIEYWHKGGRLTISDYIRANNGQTTIDPLLNNNVII